MIYLLIIINILFTYNITSNCTDFLILLIVNICLGYLINKLNNKIKDDTAEIKIQNYNNIIRDLKAFFSSKGIDTKEKREKLLKDIEKEKKFLTEEVNRPKQLLNKFAMGVVLTTFIGAVPATIQGYMNNCDKEEIVGFIPNLIVIFIFIMIICGLLYLIAYFDSVSYNKKIQQYKKFEEDLTEILYIDNNSQEDSNIPQTVSATSHSN